MLEAAQESRWRCVGRHLNVCSDCNYVPRAEGPVFANSHLGNSDAELSRQLAAFFLAFQAVTSVSAKICKFKLEAFIWWGNLLSMNKFCAFGQFSSNSKVTFSSSPSARNDTRCNWQTRIWRQGTQLRVCKTIGGTSYTLE